MAPREEKTGRPATVLGLSIAGFTLAALFLAGVTWTAFNRISGLRQATQAVHRALRTREDEGVLLSLLKDAETGERGFLVTGKAEYLEPYQSALAAILPILDRLRRETTEIAAVNPRIAAAQLKRLDILEDLSRRTISQMQSTIAVRQSRGFEAAAAMVVTGALKGLMDEIRGVFLSMQTDEAQVLADLEAAEEKQAVQAFVTTIGGLASAVVLVAAAGFFLSRALRHRERERGARAAAEAMAGAVRKAEETLRVTVMSIGDAVIATDEGGCVTRLNPIAEALTGWTAADAAGKPLQEVLVIVNEQSRKPAENPVERVLREGMVVGLANHTLLLSRDGREIPIDDSAAPIRAANGRIIGVVMVFRDITDRRRRERAAAARIDSEHARVLSRAETLARMGSWRWEPATDAVLWSPELYRIYGLPDGAPLSFAAFTERVHPEDRERVRAVVDAAVQNRAPFRYQERIIRPDGTMRVLDSQGDMEQDGDGKVVALFGLCRDVTEEQHAEAQRVRAEEALRDQQELYEKLLGAQSDAGDGVAITEGTRLVYANEALGRMYGYTVAELLALPSFLDLVVPEERDRLVDRLRRVAGENFGGLGETAASRKDGRRIRIEYAVKPAQLKGSTLLISIVRDVTDRRQAEEALRDQQELYEKLLGAQSDVGDGVTITDGTRLIYTNDALARMYGYTVEELKAMPSLLQLVVPEDRDRLTERLRRRLAGQTVGELGETRVIRKDGRQIINEYAVKPVQVKGRTLIISIVRDVTERRQAEAAIRQLSQRLIQARDEEQERIARELQSTAGRALEAIRVRLSAVRDSGTVFDWKTSEALRESLGLVQDAVSEVRTLSRLLYPPMLDDEGLSEAIRWYVFDYKQKTGVKVFLDVPLKLPRLGREAERALFRVVQESLANTARHSGSPSATVRLREQDGGELRLEIQDTGRGIPKEILEATRGTVAISGVGIRGMVERMRQLGGTLEIASDAFGTRVTAVLPGAG